MAQKQQTAVASDNNIKDSNNNSEIKEKSSNNEAIAIKVKSNSNDGEAKKENNSNDGAVAIQTTKDKAIQTVISNIKRIAIKVHALTITTMCSM